MNRATFYQPQQKVKIASTRIFLKK